MAYYDKTENTHTRASGSVPRKALPRVDGLYVSGLRSYSPKIGRWLNRDPIGTRNIPFRKPLSGLDGPNITLFVANNAVSRFDILGLFGAGGADATSLGHGDFPGSDDFDWNKEDEGWTNPFNPLATWQHFRDLDNVEADLVHIVSQCDKSNFERYMHEGQDYYSHYSAGYRWYTGGHLFAGTKPDQTLSGWLLAKSWTQGWLTMWSSVCCKKQCDKGAWVPQSTGGCAD